MVFDDSKGEVSKMRLWVLFYEFVYDDKFKRTFFFLCPPPPSNSILLEPDR